MDLQYTSRIYTCTLNQLLFARGKHSRGSLEPPHCEYFSPQTSPYHMIVKIKHVFKVRSQKVVAANYQVVYLGLITI